MNKIGWFFTFLKKNISDSSFRKQIGIVSVPSSTYELNGGIQFWVWFFQKIIPIWVSILILKISPQFVIGWLEFRLEPGLELMV